jgi:hypothetical protein
LTKAHWRGSGFQKRNRVHLFLWQQDQTNSENCLDSTNELGHLTISVSAQDTSIMLSVTVQNNMMVLTNLNDNDTSYLKVVSSSSKDWGSSLVPDKQSNLWCYRTLQQHNSSNQDLKVQSENFIIGQSQAVGSDLQIKVRAKGPPIMNIIIVWKYFGSTRSDERNEKEIFKTSPHKVTAGIQFPQFPFGFYNSF